MSEENVEQLQRVYAARGTGDFRAGVEVVSRTFGCVWAPCPRSMVSNARVPCLGGIGCDQHFLTGRPREGEMTFGEAIRSGFDHYVKFDGRASRPAFWWWVLFVLLVDIAANLIDLAIGSPYLQRNCGTGALASQPFGVDPQASRHEPFRLVDPDRPDPVDRVDRAAGLLSAAGRCRREPFRASASNGHSSGNTG